MSWVDRTPLLACLHQGPASELWGPRRQGSEALPPTTAAPHPGPLACPEPRWVSLTLAVPMHMCTLEEYKGHVLVIYCGRSKDPKT